MTVNRRRRIAAIVVATITAALATATLVLIVAARRQVRTCELDKIAPEPSAAPGVSLDFGKSIGPPLPPLPAESVRLPPPPSDIGIVIDAGGESYVAFDELLVDVPIHRPPRLVEVGFAAVAVAKVAAKDVPSHVRALRDGVTVDGHCDARVTGFALVARVRGHARDALDDGEEWTAQNVMEHGPVLAARITGCTGTYARRTTLPAIDVFTPSSDVLVDTARETFVNSQPMLDAQEQWKDAGNDGEWFESEGAHFAVSAFQHPRTRVTWIVAHAYVFDDCGQPGGNVIGIYRVEQDRTLTQVQLRRGHIARVDQVIDTDRDGEPELVNSSETGASIERADGARVVSLHASEYGCGC